VQRLLSMVSIMNKNNNDPKERNAKKSFWDEYNGIGISNVDFLVCEEGVLLVLRFFFLDPPILDS
jgi:hypothetical protein